MRPSFLLGLGLLFAACFNDDTEEVGRLEETVSVQDSVIDAQRAELDDLRAALDTARTVAVDSALAYGGEGEAAASLGNQAWPEEEALTYATYRNERFGFTIGYPDNLFAADEPLGQGHGQSFRTPDGDATLLVYGGDEGRSLREEYENELERGDLRVTYRVLRPDWFVISGYQGPYIFYQRTHRAGHGLRTFRLRHRATDKAYFDAIVERLSYSFEG